MLDLTLGIPIFNSRQTLEGTIRSVSTQSPLPRKIILIDDASTDDSLPVAKELLTRYSLPNVEILSNSGNLGIAGTYNKILSLAQSQWIQILDADDCLEPNYYSTLLKALSSDATLIVTGVTTNNRFLDEITKWVSRCVPFHPPLCLPLLGTVATRSGVLYRTETVRSYPFPDPYFDGSDILHLLHLRTKGACSFIPQAKVFYRIHAGSATATSSSSRFLEELRPLGLLAPFYYVDLFCRKKVFSFVRKTKPIRAT